MWVRVEQAATKTTVKVNQQVIGEHLGAWTPFEFEITKALGNENELEVICEDVSHVTGGFLPAVGIHWTGARRVVVKDCPTILRPSVASRASVEGTKLLVDGEPFRTRGILHWGLYPEHGGKPWPTEEQMRQEIRDVKALGFNLIKFCLWVPPGALLPALRRNGNVCLAGIPRLGQTNSRQKSDQRIRGTFPPRRTLRLGHSANINL